MPSFNKVILCGNLTRDPELKYLPNQTPLTNFGIAVNRKYKTAGGEDREEVCFVDCAAFGKQAEVISQWCKKGKGLLVEGRLRQENWEDKQTGAKRSKLSVIVDGFQFMGSKQDGDEQQATAAAPSPGGGGASRKPAAKKADQPFGDEQVFDESEIPF